MIKYNKKQQIPLLNKYLFFMENKMLKIVRIIIISSLLVIFSINQIQAKSNTDFIYPGEELTYEVSFFGIKLGTIKMITEGYKVIDGHKTILAKSLINSYNGIPFVDLHVIFQSWMSPHMSYSYQFVSNTKDSQGWYYEKIHFDYNNQKIDIKGFRKKKIVKNKTINTKRKWVDGLSLFYIARKLLYLNKNVSIPTLMDTDTVFTAIYFQAKKEQTEIDAVPYPVRTVYFKGNANWTGIYGMTGKFEGWFSDDYARIPIQAKMKLYVGSVNIELIKWKRKGWKPPK